MNMTRTQKCELFYERGFRYNPETGEITSHKRKLITGKINGYIRLSTSLDGKKINLYGHQFAWWSHYGEIHEDDKLVIDHDDRDSLNNRISNLKLTTWKKNLMNSDRLDYCKGYSFHKPSGKWLSQIWIEGKRKYLGLFDTKEEAREAYLTALAFYYPDRYKILEEKGLLDQI